MVCGLLTLFIDAEESVYYIRPSQQLCHSTIFNLGFPNVILLLNIFIALIDQWISNSKPKFHREKFTSRLVLASSLAVNFFVILLLNFVYVFGVAEIHCAYNEHHVNRCNCLGSPVVLLHRFGCFNLRQNATLSRKEDDKINNCIVE